jgi:hypothetical protein
MYNPESFSDEELAESQPVLDDRGEPICAAGNYAIVFKMVSSGGRELAVKFFHRPIPQGLQQRYERLKRRLEERALRFMVPFDYLPHEALIEGERFPVVKMDWVEGDTLRGMVEKHLDNKRVLRRLCDFWEELARHLDEVELAHGDLHPGNILWQPTSQPMRFRPRLVDYDGVWLRELSNVHPGESGTPNYQHPLRTRENPVYRFEVDRFSFLVIYTALRCLAVDGRELWVKFDNKDNLLFLASDFGCCREERAPRKSSLFEYLWDHQDEEIRHLTRHLILAGHGPLEATPALREIIRRGKIVAPSTSQSVDGDRIYRTLVRRYRIVELQAEIDASKGRPWLRTAALRPVVQELLALTPEREDLEQLLRELPYDNAVEDYEVPGPPDGDNELTESDFDLALDDSELVQEEEHLQPHRRTAPRLERRTFDDEEPNNFANLDDDVEVEAEDDDYSYD